MAPQQGRKLGISTVFCRLLYHSTLPSGQDLWIWKLQYNHPGLLTQALASSWHLVPPSHKGCMH